MSDGFGKRLKNISLSRLPTTFRAGMQPRDARRQAVLKFGAVEAVKENYREQRGLPFMETLIQDSRYAVRRLRMAPAFTVAAVLTLALGIGATTSIFTLVNAVLLKSLPVANPGELYRLGQEVHCCYLAGYSQEKEFSIVSYDLYRYLKDNTKGFSELAAFPSNQSQFGVRRSGASASIYFSVHIRYDHLHQSALSTACNPTFR